MKTKKLTFEIKGTHYKGGSFVQAASTLELMQDVILKQYKYRKECKAKDSEGNGVGAVWKDEGKWKWYYSTEHPHNLIEMDKKYSFLKQEYDKLKVLNDQVLAQRLKAEIQRDKYRGALQLASTMLGLIECIQNCDSKGTLQNGEQCQWCDERNTINQTLKNNEK